VKERKKRYGSRYVGKREREGEDKQKKWFECLSATDRETERRPEKKDKIVDRVMCV